MDYKQKPDWKYKTKVKKTPHIIFERCKESWGLNGISTVACSRMAITFLYPPWIYPDKGSWQSACPRIYLMPFLFWFHSGWVGRDAKYGWKPHKIPPGNIFFASKYFFKISFRFIYFFKISFRFCCCYRKQLPFFQLSSRSFFFGWKILKASEI